MKNELISTKEAAAILNVSYQTIVNWVRDGVFPNAMKLNPSKRNSPIRIPRFEVEVFRQSRLSKNTGLK